GQVDRVGMGLQLRAIHRLVRGGAALQCLQPFAFGLIGRSDGDHVSFHDDTRDGMRDSPCPGGVRYTRRLPNTRSARGASASRIVHPATPPPASSTRPPNTSTPAAVVAAIEERVSA